MKIRNKIVLIVMPLIIVPFILIGTAASLAARNGITRIATEFLQFKAEELRKYAETQWELLQENDLSGNQEFLNVTKEAVGSFARSLIRSKTELILAVDPQGELVMSTIPIDLSSEEAEELLKLLHDREMGWLRLRLADTERVAQAFFFQPFNWYVLVSEEQSVFYQTVNQIFVQSGIILIVAAFISIFLLFLFSAYLTRPLRFVVSVMREIISKNDMSKRVALLYGDEIGELGHTFNLMTGELEKAYGKIKGYAYKAVIAQRRERKIRNIFQKYVPNDIIEHFFANPEDMLVGDNRVLAVLFSDIRGFTSISETLLPDHLIESLNRYFGIMVDIVLSRNGVVDKYIGDALMAFYGAPVKHDDDALQAVDSGLAMLEALEAFNKWQRDQDRPPFNIGIGINYGVVTVGNIGSEQKMDYTVIGDMVNLASRLEELTKTYKEPLIISESMYSRVGQDYSCRHIDTVAVKGRDRGVKIYAPRRRLSQKEAIGWRIHHEGTGRYYSRRFHEAMDSFLEALEYMPGDVVLELFLEHCQHYLESPPPEDWDGITVMTHK